MRSTNQGGGGFRSYMIDLKSNGWCRSANQASLEQIAAGSPDHVGAVFLRCLIELIGLSVLVDTDFEISL